MSEGVSGVGSRLSGENEAARELPTPDTRPTPREPNWRLIYAAVLGELTLLVIIFYAFTKAFA